MIKQNKLLRKAQKVKLLHRGFRQHLTIERSFYMILQMFTQYVAPMAATNRIKIMWHVPGTLSPIYHKYI